MLPIVWKASLADDPENQNSNYNTKNRLGKETEGETEKHRERERENVHARKILKRKFAKGGRRKCKLESRDSDQTLGYLK